MQAADALATMVMSPRAALGVDQASAGRGGAVDEVENEEGDENGESMKERGHSPIVHCRMS